MAKISLIIAMAKNRVIGKDNKLPWHLPADLKWFKQNTMGKPIVMGRKTYESIGKPLPGRQNIIITHQQDYQAPGCDIAHHLDEAIQLAGNVEEIMVIGGSNLFRQALPLAETLYLTVIDQVFEGDTYLSTWNQAVWELQFAEKHLPDEKNPYPYEFLIYHRRDSAMR